MVIVRYVALSLVEIDVTVTTTNKQIMNKRNTERKAKRLKRSLYKLCDVCMELADSYDKAKKLTATQKLHKKHVNRLLHRLIVAHNKNALSIA